MDHLIIHIFASYRQLDVHLRRRDCGCLTMSSSRCRLTPTSSVAAYDQPFENVKVLYTVGGKKSQRSIGCEIATLRTARPKISMHGHM